MSSQLANICQQTIATKVRNAKMVAKIMRRSIRSMSCERTRRNVLQEWVQTLAHRLHKY